MNKYTAPSISLRAFNCPHCGAFAKQILSNLFADFEEKGEGAATIVKGYHLTICYVCDKIGLWRGTSLVYPIMEETNLPEPNADLDEDIQDDFVEASKILHISPRGAAAILRLCLQKLCKQLGEKGKNINDDIASLVKKGLNPKVQQALDVIRIVGNNAVHPGEIDIKDNPQTALILFNLINVIADAMISQPKHIQDLYDSLPTDALEAIHKRDSK